MKIVLSTLVFIFTIFLVNAQPCKKVKAGMSKAEVLKLVGSPTEIDSIGFDNNADESKSMLTVWQYGHVKEYDNQRVEFRGDKVEGDVIADGEKYDELMAAFQRGDFPNTELMERIKKLNRDACK